MKIKTHGIGSKAQVLSTDLLVSLIVVALAMGLSVQALEHHYKQVASTFENAKMHQIAIDAAAIKYYKGIDGEAVSYDGLNSSAVEIGYSITDSPVPLAVSCMVSSRGTKNNPVVVYVCR